MIRAYFAEEIQALLDEAAGRYYCCLKRLTSPPGAARSRASQREVEGLMAGRINSINIVHQPGITRDEANSQLHELNAVEELFLSQMRMPPAIATAHFAQGPERHDRGNLAKST